MHREFSTVDRAGVNAVERIILNDFNWIPRQILQSDFGIDLEMELVEKKIPTGRLIACQIKSGESYFKVENDGHIVFRGTNEHLNYWLNHSLPVILILHNPRTQVTIWNEVSDSTVTKTGKGWLIKIPKEKIFGGQSIDELTLLNKRYPLYFQRLLRLGLDKSLMKTVRKYKVVLELSEWVNKTIGRVSIEIKKVDDDEELLSSKEFVFYRGLDDLQLLYPWADLELDEDYYEDSDRNDFLENYGMWDPEEKCYVGTMITFHEYRSQLPAIRAISQGGGEVDFYRFVVHLNSLGKSYLELNNFLEFGNQLRLKFNK